MIYNLSRDHVLFYFLFSLAITAIYFSTPFLRVPYDMWYHLERIEYYSSGTYYIFDIKNKELWPYLWGNFFSLLQINELFLRTKIIHISQSLISLYIIYFSAQVIIRNLYKKIEPITLKYLSIWSVFIWFTIYATYSVYYHQVWILWYSINYQITLLFFWYIITLTIIIFLENPPIKKLLFYLFQLVLFSIIILWMHASEFIYVLMYFVLILFLYIHNIYTYVKKHYVITIFCCVFVIGSFYYFITGDYIYRKPPILYYLNFEHINELYPKLISLGTTAVNHYSRAYASLNELMFLSIVLLIIMGIHSIYKNLFHPQSINYKLYFFLFISSLFIFIPVNILSAGIASLLFAPAYVNRFYYASSIFVILPVVIYYFFRTKTIWIINLLISFLIVCTFLYSKYLSSTHNYYMNLISIKNSYKNTIGFHLSEQDIKLIGERITKYEYENDGKQNYYYARDDIALVIKLIYKKPVLWRNHGNANYTKSFHSHSNVLFNPILFETPKNLSTYKKFR